MNLHLSLEWDVLVLCPLSKHLASFLDSCCDLFVRGEALLEYSLKRTMVRSLALRCWMLNFWMLAFWIPADTSVCEGIHPWPALSFRPEEDFCLSVCFDAPSKTLVSIVCWWSSQ